jgi:hypothetical protein
MIPAGYMAKHVAAAPAWLAAPGVVDLYSVSACISRNFADYVNHWRHNGYWLFDSPGVMAEVAGRCGADLAGTRLFYYEVFELQYRQDGCAWESIEPESAFGVAVHVPRMPRLEGYDVATFSCGTTPECSPLSCNGLAARLTVNSHCLIPSFDEARAHVDGGAFADCEPGPLRIFAVYSVPTGRETTSL